MRRERLRHRAADGAEADDADLQALEAGQIVAPPCGRGTPRSCRALISASAQAKRRSSSDAAVTAYSATALLLPPGTLATGMPSRVSAA